MYVPPMKGIVFPTPVNRRTHDYSSILILKDFFISVVSKYFGMRVLSNNKPFLLSDLLVYQVT